VESRKAPEGALRLVYSKFSGGAINP